VADRAETLAAVAADAGESGGWAETFDAAESGESGYSDEEGSGAFAATGNGGELADESVAWAEASETAKAIEKAIEEDQADSLAEGSPAGSADDQAEDSEAAEVDGWADASETDDAADFADGPQAVEPVASEESAGSSDEAAAEDVNVGVMVDEQAQGTGHPAVDAALRAVINAEALPVAEQLAAYEGAHQTLREVLASIED
jgi:hypothetical protein